MFDKSRISKNTCINPISGCWEWIRSTDEDGYARLEATQDVKIFVHRYAYESFKGEIPSNMTVDHICRNRKCCNPEHLRLMTVRDNVLSGDTIAARNLAKTHCLRGHEFTEQNTHKTRGERVCKACAKIRADRMKVNGKKQKLTILQKILNKVRLNDDGCLIWTGATHNDGNGYLVINKKTCAVHKAVYQEIKGNILTGMGVYRKCGNKLCCAIEHMHLLPFGSTFIGDINVMKGGCDNR